MCATRFFRISAANIGGAGNPLHAEPGPTIADGQTRVAPKSRGRADHRPCQVRRPARTQPSRRRPRRRHQRRPRRRRTQHPSPARLAEGSFAPTAGRPRRRNRSPRLSAIRAARARLSKIAFFADDYLANLPTEAGLKALAATVKGRWICEQAHQELKEEFGLDHFEGRSRRGPHRHALMTMIAYAFLQHRRLATASERKKTPDASGRKKGPRWPAAG